MNFPDYYEYYSANDSMPSSGYRNDPIIDMERSMPAIPLPNPGEGGAAPSDSNMPAIPLPDPGEGGPANGGNFPMIPLPSPGEGGPANGGNFPMIPLPSPGEGGPANGGSFPMIPLPGPGEGGPVAPGGNSSTIITVLPRPIVPCFFCNSNSFGNVRFLNAATGYNPFRISIGGQTVIATLDYAEISQYGRVSAGYQTVTVSGQNGYVYLRKQIAITAGSKMTVAVVNTAGGLDLAQISDVNCNTPMNLSCLRACNLSHNSGPLNLILSNGFVIFRNIQFMEVTNYNRLMQGRYQFYVSRGSRVLISSDINVQSNSLYTIYIFNWNNSPDALRTLIVEDRK